MNLGFGVFRRFVVIVACLLALFVGVSQKLRAGNADDEPVVLVNGHLVLGLNSLSVIDPAHVSNINVWKDEKKKAEYARFGERTKNGVVEITLVPETESLYSELWTPVAGAGDSFEVLEKFPEFPGGSSEVKAFISKNLEYPTVAEKAKVRGEVAVSFMVYKDGSHGDYKILRSMLKDADGNAADSSVVNACGEEAIRVCKLMPQFVPGSMHTKDGWKNVDVRFVMPFSFIPKGEKVVRIR